MSSVFVRLAGKIREKEHFGAEEGEADEEAEGGLILAIASIKLRREANRGRGFAGNKLAFAPSGLCFARRRLAFARGGHFAWNRLALTRGELAVARSGLCFARRTVARLRRGAKTRPEERDASGVIDERVAVVRAQFAFFALHHRRIKQSEIGGDNDCGPERISGDDESRGQNHAAKI